MAAARHERSRCGCDRLRPGRRRRTFALGETGRQCQSGGDVGTIHAAPDAGQVSGPAILIVLLLAGPVLVRDGEPAGIFGRSEEHTSELQSLMRISYAVFCLKKKT